MKKGNFLRVGSIIEFCEEKINYVVIPESWKRGTVASAVEHGGCWYYNVLYFEKGQNYKWYLNTRAATIIPIRMPRVIKR